MFHGRLALKKNGDGAELKTNQFFIIFGEFHFMLLDDLETVFDWNFEFELARPD